MDDVLALPRPAAASASGHISTEEHVKNVHGRREAAAAFVQSFLDRLFPALIVNLSFLFVGKHFVRLRDGFELC